MEVFGDHVYFFSPTGWLGKPDFDGAIEAALKDNRTDERIKLSKEYTWDKIFDPLKSEIDKIALNLGLNSTPSSSPRKIDLNGRGANEQPY